MQFIMTIIAFNVFVLGDPKERIMNLLRKDEHFYQHWTNLIQLQSNQTLESDKRNPLVNFSYLMTECTRMNGFRMDHSDSLRPSDVQIYAELGHLSRFCKHNISSLLNGNLDSCLHPGYTMPLPSIDKFLSIYNSKLKIIKSLSNDSDLSMQTAYLMKIFQKHHNFRSKWKLIVIMPNMQDGGTSEPMQTAVEVLNTIKELYRIVPQKTFIVVVRSADSGIWQDALYANLACRKLLEDWRSDPRQDPTAVWEQVEKISESHFRTDTFSVQILRLFDNSTLFASPGSLANLSILGYNCAQFSAHGLSLLHVAVWNSLMSRSSYRVVPFQPLVNAPICADPLCPYFRTRNNSALCLWNPLEKSSDIMSPEKLIALGSFLIGLVLFAIVLITFRLASPSQKQANFGSSFGQNLTWLSYIDEDHGKLSIISRAKLKHKLSAYSSQNHNSPTK